MFSVLSSVLGLLLPCRPLEPVYFTYKVFMASIAVEGQCFSCAAHYEKAAVSSCELL